MSGTSVISPGKARNIIRYWLLSGRRLSVKGSEGENIRYIKKNIEIFMNK